MTIAVIVILLMGVVLYMQARKRGDTKQGRTLRMVALIVMVLALAVAVIVALDVFQDSEVEVEDVPQEAVQRANA